MLASTIQPHQRIIHSRQTRSYRFLGNAKEEHELPPAVERNPEHRRIVGTLSFPVKNSALRDNGDLISEVIRRRRPGLLLSAGWSISSQRKLQPIENATRETGTVVILETSTDDPPISFRIEH